MLRHLAASWLFAGFLVVVAVATWRVLDARTPEPPVAPAPVASAPPVPPVPPVLVEAAPLPTPPPPRPAPVTRCGSGHDPFAGPDIEPSGTAILQFGSQPFADLTIDGKSYGSTPFYGPRKLTIAVGTHDVVLRDKTDDRRYHFRLDVSDADPENKVIVVLRHDEARPVRTTGCVTLTSLDMSEAQAQEAFSEAVNALRDRRISRGCDLLETIADRTLSTMRWHEKAENLYARRCD